MAETEAEERPIKFADPLPYRALLFHRPRKLAYVPDVHGSTHDPQRVIALERRNSFALVELDRIPCNAVCRKESAKYTGMLACYMLKDEEAHALTTRCRCCFLIGTCREKSP